MLKFVNSVTRRLNDMLSGWPATIVSGVFLLFDLVPHLLYEFGVYTQQAPFWPKTAWISVAISGLPLLYNAAQRLIYAKGIGKISSALLITIAMIAAIAIGDLFAAGEVAFIMAIGELLEDMTTDRARRGLKGLVSLAPPLGRIVNSNAERMVPVEQIRVGNILRVLPGERVPVDGVIVSGTTSLDQSVLTGEWLPVDRSVGDKVFCGTVNCYGSVDIEAIGVGKDSSLQQLIRLVEQAENKKADISRVADRAASWLVPAALLIAVLTLIITGNIERAVTVLVVFCPCSLVLATPTAIMAAIGQATKHGVIIKSGEALEKMGRVDRIAFDKTGTLTCGRLEVSDITELNSSAGEGELLRLAASVELRSEHPVGKAIVELAKRRSAALTQPEQFKMMAGKGVLADIDGQRVLCGNERLLAEHQVSVDQEAAELIARLRSQGKATVAVACEGKLAGVIGLSDVVRPCSRDTVDRLNSMQVQVALLSGDSRQAAEYLAGELGIGEVYSELLPEQKVSTLERLESQGSRVCMVGDGVNDAPALRCASVGVAMGSMGSDIAVEAADIALMSDDVSKIHYLKRLSVATLRTIHLGIVLSMLINICAVALSVMGLLGPTTGALVHNAGSCLVVLIAAMLYDRKFD